MEASFEQLRHAMTRAAQHTFSVYKKQHAGEHFYAFALYTADDARGANCAASTEESLRRAAQKYSDSGYSVPEPGHLRYIPDEWPYSGAEGNVDEWTQVWLLNDVLADDRSRPFPIFREKSLETMLLALKDLDAEGFFGSGKERERITLLVWITDSPDAEAWWVRSVKELNPVGVYERFILESPSWCEHRNQGSESGESRARI